MEPWTLRETGLDLDALAETESLFALANGHVGLRGILDEAEPHGIPGSYLNGFHELRSLPGGEGDCADPQTVQSRVNVPNGLIIRLQVDDEAFDVRAGHLRSHERELDFRAGVLNRTAEWISPRGHGVRLSSVRLASLVEREIAAVRYEVVPLQATRFVIRSELLANEPMPAPSVDPRAGGGAGFHLRSEHSCADATRAVLVHSTVASELRVGVGMDHLIEAVAGTVTSSQERSDDRACTILTADVEAGGVMRIVKFLAYDWSSRQSGEILERHVETTLDKARATGWDELLAGQRRYLDDFWRRSDVELEGDPELQQALRLALFHTLQATARNERRAIAAKGLTGPGYGGHAFWDTEAFVLPVLTYIAPDAAREALIWRHGALGHAQSRAKRLGLAGAAFAWRTIAGEECSGYWPAGTAAFHVNAAIAHAVARYVAASADHSFERDVGLELLVETARLWRSLGHLARDGRFHINGVTGPDEYSALADDNVYTNLMAQLNLHAAADAAARHPEQAIALGVSEQEMIAWREAANAVAVPLDGERGVHPQDESFLRRQTWDFAETAAERYPLFLNVPYFDLYRKQVIKQADLVLALHLRGDAFSLEEKARDFAYYEQLTVRDSSISACTQAVVAAELGHLDLAYDYFAETALIDLEDAEGNTSEGLHLASLAGAWSVAVAGFGGMRDHAGALSFAPRLGGRLTRLAFSLQYRGRRLTVEVLATTARYTLVDGAPLEVRHHGELIHLAALQPITRALPPPPSFDRPRQPPGRVPARRGREVLS